MADMHHLVQIADEAFQRFLLVNTDVQKAYAYADAAHSADDQRRKWSNRPYIEHPRMVAGVLLTTISKPPYDNGFVTPVQAALLHDVIEDTCCTAEDLLRHFPGDVVELVEELTEPDDPLYWKSLGYDGRPNRSIRRALECDRRSTISAMGQTLSCADIIANSHDIVGTAPHDFAKMYQGELSDRLQALTRADEKLWNLAKIIVDDNLVKLREYAA